MLSLRRTLCAYPLMVLCVASCISLALASVAASQLSPQSPQLAQAARAPSVASLDREPEVDAYWPRSLADETHRAASLAPASSDSGGANWSYDRLSPVGPQRWAEIVPACGGARQSPIDIDTSSVQGDRNLKPLCVAGPAAERFVVNAGHTLQINENPNATSTLSGDVDNSTYALTQAHIHMPGEHRVNGGAYPLEMHFVHTRSAAAAPAQPNENDFAVVGALFKEGAHHAGLEAFVRAVSAPGFNKTDSINSALIDLRAMLPDSLAYFTYDGSLTTPSCLESVQWYVLRDVQEASPEQLALLRLASPVQQNNRPVQSTGKRIVRTFPIDRDRCRARSVSTSP